MLPPRPQRPPRPPPPRPPRPPRPPPPPPWPPQPTAAWIPSIQLLTVNLISYGVIDIVNIFNL